MADVLILTGPPGAGKSSVAVALAERYDRVAHIDVDTLRHFITPTSFAPAGQPGFKRQQALATRNACAVALNFLQDRIAAIIDDVVIEHEHFDQYLDGLRAAGVPLHFVRLLPSLEVCQERNRSRPRDERLRPQRVALMHGLFLAAGKTGGVMVDSGGLTAYETADRLQALTTSGQSIVWRPGDA